MRDNQPFIGKGGLRPPAKDKQILIQRGWPLADRHRGWPLAARHGWNGIGFGPGILSSASFDSLNKAPPFRLIPCSVLLKRAGRSQEELGARSEEVPGEATVEAVRSQEEPGEAKRSQEKPRGARRTQEEPGEPKRSQEKPRGSRRTQEEPGRPKRSQETSRPKRSQEDPRGARRTPSPHSV